MKKHEDALWEKFVKTGRIDDYLNYKFYLRKKEEQGYETGHSNGGPSSQNDGL